MSTRLPPDYPEEESQKEIERRAGELRERIQRTQEAVKTSDTAEFFQHFGQLERLLDRLENLPHTKLEMLDNLGKAEGKGSSFPQWLNTTLQGLTLASIVGVAFWLGSVSTTVSRSAENINKLNDAIIGVGRDGISNRLTAIETKIDGLDKRLNQPAQAPNR